MNLFSGISFIIFSAIIHLFWFLVLFFASKIQKYTNQNQHSNNYNRNPHKHKHNVKQYHHCPYYQPTQSIICQKTMRQPLMIIYNHQHTEPPPYNHCSLTTTHYHSFTNTHHPTTLLPDTTHWLPTTSYLPPFIDIYPLQTHMTHWKYFLLIHIDLTIHNIPTIYQYPSLAYHWPIIKPQSTHYQLTTDPYRPLPPPTNLLPNPKPSLDQPATFHWPTQIPWAHQSDRRKAENFDKHFTKVPMRNTPTDSLIIQNMDSKAFRGFTYSNPYFLPPEESNML